METEWRLERRVVGLRLFEQGTNDFLKILSLCAVLASVTGQ